MTSFVYVTIGTSLSGEEEATYNPRNLRGPTTDVTIVDELLDGFGALFSPIQTTVGDEVTVTLEDERTLPKTRRRGRKITPPSRYSD